MGIWSCMAKTPVVIFGLGFCTHAVFFSNLDEHMLKTQLETVKQTINAQIEYFKQPSKVQIAKYREMETKFETKYREMEKRMDYLVKLSATQIFELREIKKKCCDNLGSESEKIVKKIS